MSKPAFYNVFALKSEDQLGPRKWCLVASSVTRDQAAAAVAKEWKAGHLCRTKAAVMPKVA